jgi:hypothetical protein
VRGAGHTRGVAALIPRPRAEVAPGAGHLPGWLADLARRAVADACGDGQAGRRYQPDVAVINHYDARATMGLHAGRDERSLAPVVSPTGLRPRRINITIRESGLA